MLCRCALAFTCHGVRSRGRSGLRALAASAARGEIEREGDGRNED